MATGLASFFVDIGIHGDTLTLKDMVHMMSDLKIESLAQLDVLNMLKNSFKDVFNEALQHGTKLKEITDLFGLDPKVLSSWENVAFIMGGSVQDADEAMTHMQDVLANMKEGHVNTSYNEGISKLELGESVKDVTKAEDLFAILLTRMTSFIKENGGGQKALDEARVRLRQVGISDPKILQIMLGGTSHFNNLAGRVGGYDAGEIQKWAALNEEMNTLILQWKVFIRHFEESSIPTLLKVGQEALDVSSGKSKPSLDTLPLLAGGATTLTAGGLALLLGAPAWPAMLGALGLAYYVDKQVAGHEKGIEASVDRRIDMYFHGTDADTAKRLFHELNTLFTEDQKQAKQADLNNTTKKALSREHH